jgi:hypothetical protein
LLFESDKQMLRAFPRLPALREPGLRFLPDALGNAVRSSPDYSACAEGRFWFALPSRYLCGVTPDASPQPLAWAIVLERTDRDAAAIEPLAPDDFFAYAVRALYRKPPDLRSLARLRSGLRSVRAYRARSADPARMARQLCRVLQCER